MTEFVRVRSAKGPRHEFFAAAGEVAANPDRYEVVDAERVSKAGPVRYLSSRPSRVGFKPVGTPIEENE